MRIPLALVLFTSSLSPAVAAKAAPKLGVPIAEGLATGVALRGGRGVYKTARYGSLAGWAVRRRMQQRPGSVDAATTLLARLLGEGELVDSRGLVQRFLGKAGSVAWRSRAGELTHVGTIDDRGVLHPDLSHVHAKLEAWALGQRVDAVTEVERTVDEGFWSHGTVRGDWEERTTESSPLPSLAYSQFVESPRGRTLLPVNRAQDTTYGTSTPAHRLGLIFGPGTIVRGAGPTADRFFWKTLDGKQVSLGEMKSDALGVTRFVISPSARRLRDRYLGEMLVEYVRSFAHNADYRYDTQTSKAQHAFDAGGEELRVPYLTKVRVNERVGEGNYVLDMLGNPFMGNLPRWVAGALHPTPMMQSRAMFTNAYAPITLGFRTRTVPGRPDQRLPTGMVIEHALTLSHTDTGGTSQAITHEAKLTME